MELSKQSEWARLETSIGLLIDNLHVNNIKSILVELFKLNLYKGKGLLARKIIQAQRYEHRQRRKPSWIYASLINVLNYRIPEIGDVIINKLVIIFKQEYYYNKYLNIELICELVNYKVLNNLIVLQVIELLMNNMSDESIKVVIRIIRIAYHSIPANISYLIIDRLRNLLNEGELSEYNRKGVNQLLNLRKRGFREHKGDILIEGENCHEYDLQGKFCSYNQLMIDDGKDYKEYELLKQEIMEELGVSNTHSVSNGGEGEEENEVEELNEPTEEKVVDMSQTELIQLQKTVYLTIMSSLTSDEAVHKLLKLNYDPKILTDIIIKSCLQEKVYSKYYGMISEILILKFPEFKLEFETKFITRYEVIHQLELNEIRNFGKLYGYLISTNKLPIDLLKVIKLTENDTNSSSRIFVKFLLKEIVEELGLGLFRTTMWENQSELTGMFPLNGFTDDLIFAINYFTAIGLGLLTDEMRQELQARKERGRSRSRSGSEASYSRSESEASYSRSGSEASYSRSGSEASFSRSESEDN